MVGSGNLGSEVAESPNSSCLIDLFICDASSPRDITFSVAQLILTEADPLRYCGLLSVRRKSRKWQLAGIDLSSHLTSVSIKPHPNSAWDFFATSSEKNRCWGSHIGFVFMAPVEGSMADSTPASSTTVAGLQPLSCIRCAHRKVKCSRVYPCTNCSKQSAQCEFPPRRTEKRRRKAVSNGATAQEIQARLNRYEELLKRNGIDPDEPESQSMPSEVQIRRDPASSIVKQEIPGRLMVNGKKSRYMEGNLWTEAGPMADEVCILVQI